MAKKYHLWLDESGDFQKEQGKKGDPKKKPSLVGGILIDEENAKKLLANKEIFRSIAQKGGHVIEMNNKVLDKKEHVLPTLLTIMRDYGAKQVFFENQEYEDGENGSNRQLYLRLMAEGIVQLLGRLSAVETEGVELGILIAQRQDVTVPEPNRKIKSEEYIGILKNRIDKIKEERKILFHSDTELKFEIKVAHRDRKLQLADYACNTRLTRGSKPFAKLQSELEELYSYDNAYIFSMNEVNTITYIANALTRFKIADAIFELYTTQDKIDEKQQLNLIIEKMQNAGYRLVKSQLKQCASEMIAYANKMDDYKIGEQFFESILESDWIIKMEEAKNIPYRKLHFDILLQLSDMYLREGNIIKARERLGKCREVQMELGNNLEEVFSYYQLLEKEAVLYINEFDYSAARDLMGNVVNSYKQVLELILIDDHLKERFKDLKSEYLGDALCMQIYAMMFLQREHPDSYEELCNLSNLGLKQYPPYEEELERHRQYRCHIECEGGNFLEALQWLFLVKGIKVVEKELVKDYVEEFFKQINEEIEISYLYYLMYYAHVMSEAKRVGNPIGDTMYQAIASQQRFLGIVKEEKPKGSTLTEVDLTPVKEESSNKKYHPIEMIEWKCASYLYYDEKYKKAYEYYGRAVVTCFADESNHTMRITGCGIQAEFICCLLVQDDITKAKNKFLNLKKKIKGLMEDDDMSEGTRRFVQRMQDKICNLDSAQLETEKLMDVARMITY